MQAIDTDKRQWRPIFHGKNVDETDEFLTGRNFCVDFPVRDDTPIDARVNGIYLPGIFVGHFGYGRPMTVKATPARTDYWVQLPTRERFEVEIGQRRFACDSRRAVVLSPMHENVIHSERFCGRLALSLTRDAMVRQLTALLAQPLHAPIELSPAMNIEGGYGRSLARHLRAAMEDFEQGDSVLHNPLSMNNFEQFIVTALLLAHPHNYSAALRRPERAIASRDVKRAIDYMESNVTAMVTLADVVTAAGVSGRALFKHFRNYTHYSPMQYLREARFRRVHEALQRAAPEESVTEIAARFGFDHMGRFGVEYRRRFGVKPSQTKERRKKDG
jgi:AraC-like DNA-binding protein